MAEFINTADIIGDDEMCDQIIQRTVTEYKENRITTVGQYAFYKCSELETVDLPNVTVLEKFAFANCSKLKSVNLPNADLMQGNNTAANQAFRWCWGLKRLSLPKVTQASNSVFRDSGFEILDFGSVVNLGIYSINNCPNLKALIIRTNAVASIGAIHQDVAIAQGTCYVYVPRALVDSYKVATNWSAYPNQFRALEDYTVDGTVTGELDETKI